ncbi:MAG: FHA domain-containing protein [Chloroflexi bacterium]|nr:FHA domain-containing protein [Chloroflexota bacterium]
MPNNIEKNPSKPQPTAFLVVQNQVFPITNSVTAIGRRLTNHLVIDDPRVSRIHAQIRVIKDQFFIVDLNSTGGTFVNGQKVSQTLLYTGDNISLSGFEIVFMQDSARLEKEAEDYTSPNITSAAQDKKTSPKANKV